MKLCKLLALVAVNLVLGWVNVVLICRALHIGHMRGSVEIAPLVVHDFNSLLTRIILVVSNALLGFYTYETLKVIFRREPRGKTPMALGGVETKPGPEKRSEPDKDGLRASPAFY